MSGLAPGGFGRRLLAVPSALVKDGLNDVGNKVVGDRSLKLGGKGRRHAGNELPAVAAHQVSGREVSISVRRLKASLPSQGRCRGR